MEEATETKSGKRKKCKAARWYAVFQMATYETVNLTAAPFLELSRTLHELFQGLALTLKGMAHFTNRHEIRHHLGDDIKRMPCIYLGRDGLLNDRLVLEVLKDYPAVCFSNYNEHRKFLVK